jgi:transcriptional regulator with AAA-type ATPase domain
MWDREGLLAAANGDTLFLDEVGDVSRELQRLLIKALEEKQYHPLGDDQPRKSDFRLLTATNIDQARLKDRLDPDFLDRISLMTLHIPPLREIREEMPWLWETVFDQARQRSGIATPRALLSDKQHRSMASRLMQHPLPGNLRDLFRAAYRLIAVRSDPDEPLSPDDSIDYALECLETTDNLSLSGDAVSKDVARAFAESKSLDSILKNGEPLPSKQVEADLKAFMAGELKRYAKRHGLPLAEISDVTERTLRTWLDRKG